MAKKPAKTADSIEIIARGVLRRGQAVLLCRNTRKGYYYLPGGHIEPGESAAEALAREFHEETGLKVRAGAPLLASEVRFRDGKKSRHEYNLVFQVEHSDGRPPERVRSREPGIEFEWVDLAAIVDSDLRPAGIRAWLISAHPDDDAIVWVSESV